MYSSDCVNKNDVKEMLDWELSLDNKDLRAHAWYHGNISRQTAESLLENEGDFLLRDCTSSGNPADCVLTCRWNNQNLHFILQRDVFQKDTIYEQLRYRFEFESFDTVSDLITYHVGSGMPISATSGALITNPKNRIIPITQGSKHVQHGSKGDYITLENIGTPQPTSIPVFDHLENVSTLEGNKLNLSLNLESPHRFLEELKLIPCNIRRICDKVKKPTNIITKGTSIFDLSAFESILLPLPTHIDDARMNSVLLETILNRLEDASESLIALHITKLDWEVLSTGIYRDDQEVSEDSLCQGLYALYFHNSQHRWNNVIERSLTMSQFVVLTITLSKKPDETLHKWMTVAEELKSCYGNFFSFCSIMRGLLMPAITRTDGKINWLHMRSDFTNSTFTFETALRSTFQGLVGGTESYPPNTGIPELLSGALIMEDALELLPISCIAGEESQLTFIAGHLNDLRNLAKWQDIQKRNTERFFSENVDNFDFVLKDILRTELQLILLWGNAYRKVNLKSRCERFDRLVEGL